jgi:hypothetical protein
MEPRFTPGPWIVKDAIGTGDVHCGYEIEPQRAADDFNYRGDVARVEPRCSAPPRPREAAMGEGKQTAWLVALALSACATDPLAQFNGKPITCESFATQAEAQRFYEAHIEHAITLDPKHTGVACKGMRELGHEDL